MAIKGTKEISGVILTTLKKKKNLANAPAALLTKVTEFEE